MGVKVGVVERNVKVLRLPVQMEFEVLKQHRGFAHPSQAFYAQEPLLPGQGVKQVSGKARFNLAEQTGLVLNQ
jgi:hypothetical protein